MTNELALFDLDGTLWNLKNDDIWIIDKDNPYKPIITISDIEFSLIKNGNYINDHIQLNYNGKTFYISNELFNLIKFKAKSENPERFGISFMPKIKKELLNKKEFDILLKNIEHLRYNKFVDIGLLTARSNQKNHSDLLNKLRIELNKIGIDIKKIFFVGSKGYISSPIKKLNVILEHLIGLKIDGNKFVYLKQDWYKKVSFYDDDIKNIDYCDDIQDYFNDILKNTDDELYNIIIDRIENYDIILETNLVTNNDLNKFKKNKIKLKMPNRYPIQESLLNEESWFNFKRKEKDKNEIVMDVDRCVKNLKIAFNNKDVINFKDYYSKILELITNYLLECKYDENPYIIKKLELFYLEFLNNYANAVDSSNKDLIQINAYKLNSVNNLFNHVSIYYGIKLTNDWVNKDDIVVYKKDNKYSLIRNETLQKLIKSDMEKHKDIDPYGEEDWQNSN